MNWSALLTTIVGAGIKYGPEIVTFIEKEGPVIKALLVAGHDLIEKLKADGATDSTAVAKGATVAGGTLLTHIGSTQFPDDFKAFIERLPIPLPNVKPVMVYPPRETHS